MKILTKKGDEILVDPRDYDLVTQYSWYVVTDHNVKYAYTNITKMDGKKSTLKMHRLILNPPATLSIDHINHNGLDNRRQNLRLATQQQNSLNNRYCNLNLGIRQLPSRRFSVRLKINKIETHIGVFDTIEEARQQYLKAVNQRNHILWSKK
jgi:hypothetical protein